MCSRLPFNCFLAIAVICARLNVASSCDGTHRRDSPTHWSYSHPDEWSISFPICDGRSQSPIDINPSNTIRTNFEPLVLGNYGAMSVPMNMINNGHTALVSLPNDYPAEKTPYVRKGGLTDRYIFSQLHFHWGINNHAGSEHTIDSNRYPGEIHFVHYNERYGSFMNATSQHDGLAVLGVFIETGNVTNMKFEPIAEALPAIVEEDSETTLIHTLQLVDLLPSHTSSFYRYGGSLTSPQCQEIVVWTVFDEPISISEKQFMAFGDLVSDGGHLLNNHRPVQPLKGRKVLQSQGHAPHVF